MSIENMSDEIMYRVTWVIDLTASDAKQAAELVRDIQHDPPSIADYFMVKSADGTEIDLDDGEQS